MIVEMFQQTVVLEIRVFKEIVMEVTTNIFNPQQNIRKKESLIS